MAQRYAIRRAGGWSEQPDNGFQSGVGESAINHPPGWLAAASPSEIADVGALLIVDDDPPGPDRRVVGRHLVERAGVAVYVYDTEPLPIEEPVVPASVTPRQLRLALLAAGKLAQVETFVGGGQAPPEAVISWEYATEFLRSDPMLGQFAARLGMTDDDVDGLFIAAAQIQ